METKAARSEKWTPGPWMAFNLVSETGDRMTAEELGAYVAECVRVGDPNRFLAISQDSGGPDICHVGNGPDGPYNSRLIAAAPDLYDALDAIADLWRLPGSNELVARMITEQVMGPAMTALAKARGEL